MFCLQTIIIVDLAVQKSNYQTRRPDTKRFAILKLLTYHLQNLVYICTEITVTRMYQEKTVCQKKQRCWYDYERGMFEITMYGQQSDLNSYSVKNHLWRSGISLFNPNCEVFSHSVCVRAALGGVARLEAVWNFLRAIAGGCEDNCGQSRLKTPAASTIKLRSEPEKEAGAESAQKDRHQWKRK